MNEGTFHAMNAMSEVLVEGVAHVRMSSLGVEHRRQLGNAGVDQVLIDTSICRANSTVLINDVVRCTAPAESWLSTAAIEWWHQAEVEYLPTIFDSKLAIHISPSLRKASVNPKPTGVR